MRIDRQAPHSMIKKFLSIDWMLVLVIIIMASIGFAMMYSAANGNTAQWMLPQMKRFAVFFVGMIAIIFIPLRWVLRWAYLAYVGALILLVMVEYQGVAAMGAKRWISIAGFYLQPSELMKVCLVLALARYFHYMHYKDIGRILYMVPPIIMALLPCMLILMQPDLGTALILLIVGGALFFAAGVKLWKFGVVLASGVVSVPFIWHHLHAYQKQRVLTFLDPERDALGAGYNIIQSQIAIGSGGVTGKGFMSGSQNQLNFLPEKHTDFVFTMLSEELGFIGGAIIILLYAVIIGYGIMIGTNSRSHFGQLLAIGVTTVFFAHVFINIAMVMGMIPVVGAPLPLLSFGGTMMMTILFAYGLVLNVSVNNHLVLERNAIGG